MHVKSLEKHNSEARTSVSDSLMTCSGLCMPSWSQSLQCQVWTPKTHLGTLHWPTQGDLMCFLPRWEFELIITYLRVFFFQLETCNDKILLGALKSKQNLGLSETLCPDFVSHCICPHNDACSQNSPVHLSSLYLDHCPHHSESRSRHTGLLGGLPIFHASSLPLHTLFPQPGKLFPPPLPS